MTIKPNLQLELFKHKIDEGGCNSFQIDLLAKEGLLSFTTEDRDDFEKYEIRELKFLKSLYFDSGLPTSIVKTMLIKLEKPYAYSFYDIYWDYESRAWKNLPQDNDSFVMDNLKEIISENFYSYLDNIETEDSKNLIEMRDQINKKLKQINNIDKTK